MEKAQEAVARIAPIAAPAEATIRSPKAAAE
jgi:hypothetical protein